MASAGRKLHDFSLFFVGAPPEATHPPGNGDRSGIAQNSPQKGGCRLSFYPKLHVEQRERILHVAKRKYEIKRTVAELLDEERQLPTLKQLAHECGVCYHTARRLILGTPYRNERKA
jgi:bacterioferritin-associated ferredoxin